MSNTLVNFVTKNATPTETDEYRTLVAINSSENREFTKKLSQVFRNNSGFSIMHNPAARDTAERTRNLSLAINHAVKVDADLIVCVSCRNPGSVKGMGLEESQKGGFKPVVNVLSPQLLEATALCKDMACIKKFPGELEQSIWKVFDEFAEDGVKRIPLDDLNRKFEEKRKEESAANHWVRRALRHMSEGKILVEIEVFPKNSEETARAVEDSATIARRLQDFNSKKRDVLDDTRLSLHLPGPLQAK